MIARTLDRRIALRTPDQALFQTLRYLACDPEIPERAPLDHRITVVGGEDEFRVVEEGAPARRILLREGVLDYLHARIFALSVADLPNVPLLHGALLRKAGRRLLLIGSKETGKTTLTLRLMAAGFDIEGDENVFVPPDGRAIARPRGLRVKQASLPFVADLAPAIVRSPFLTDFRGQKIYNCDPRGLGAAWRIEAGPVDVVVVLRANHGGFSSIRPVPTLELLQSVMTEAWFSAGGKGPAIASIIGALGRSRGYDLSLGDHAGALRCIDRAMQEAA